MHSGRSVAARSAATNGRQTAGHSSITDATTTLPSERRVIIASEWHFRPEGVKDVTQRFEAKLRGLDLQASYQWIEKDSMFRLKCQPWEAGKVASLLQEAMMAIIREETKRDLTKSYSDSENSDDDDETHNQSNTHDFQSKKIIALDKHWIEKKHDELMRAAIEQPTGEAIQATAEQTYPEEIRYFKFRTIWGASDLHIDHVLPDNVIDNFRKLTECGLVKDLGRNRVFIGAHNEEHIRLAERKLEIMWQYTRTGPYVSHIFYSESDKNVEFSIMPFIAIKQRFFESTLLDNLHGYNTIRNAFTIRCALYNGSRHVPLKKSSVEPLASEADQVLPLKDWALYKFARKGNLPLSITAILPSPFLLRALPKPQRSSPIPETLYRAISPTAVARESGIQEWAEKVTIVNPKLDSKPAWDTYQEYNPDKVTEQVPQWLPDPPRNSNISALPVPQAQMTTKKSQAQEIAPILELSQEQYPILKPTPTRKVNPDFDEKDIFNNNSGLTLLDDDISTAIPIEPLQPTIRTSGERLQTTSEVTTRGFHSTMSQRAPKPNPYHGRLEQPVPLPMPKKRLALDLDQTEDPLPEFLEAVKAQFTAMADGIRGFRGPLDIRADFGRIILQRFAENQVARKNHELTHPSQYIIEDLLAHPTDWGPHTFFTRVLTTISSEIQYLIDMKNRAGNLMWEPKPFQWSVAYVFAINDLPSRSRFFIEIDAETFQMQIHTRPNLGGIYIHGSRRHWDLKLCPVGSITNQSPAECIGLGNAIISSLMIPPNYQVPVLAFELEARMKERFEVVDIRVCRISKYKSRDGVSALNVTELQELVTISKPNEKNGHLYFSQPEPMGQKPLSRWYEVGVSSLKITEQLKQNEGLELGEEAIWTPESLKNEVGSLVLPALEILKQMDGVGFYNDNGVDVRTTQAALPGFSQIQAPQEKVEWW